MKKNILIILICSIVFTIVGVYAATTYLASEIAYKDTTVESALDELYELTPKKFCELKSGSEYAIGSKYECDPGDGVKRNFYVLRVNNNQVELIMEHNITEGSSNTAITWTDAMNYFNTGIGASIKSSWNNVLYIDLPGAQEIADAVGNTGWRLESKNCDGWFYLDSNNGVYGQTQIANSSNISNYAWLYNYTRGCLNNGCVESTNLGSTEAYGYWTKDSVAQPKDSTGYAWNIGSDGYLAWGIISGNSQSTSGVRPVITVLKNNL